LLHCFKIRCYRATKSLHRLKERFQSNTIASSLKKEGFSSKTIASLLQKEGFWSDKIASSLLQESEVAEKSLNRNFLKGLKRQNRFICTFLRVNSIGVALIDSFFLDRAHHWIGPRHYLNFSGASKHQK
jgi:hypothetical protein